VESSTRSGEGRLEEGLGSGSSGKTNIWQTYWESAVAIGIEKEEKGEPSEDTCDT